MTELLVVIVTALVVIAAATVVGPRLGIASPLVLVAIGVAASFLPVFSSTHIDPEWILEGVLPPLLYSSAVSMPAINFRREFGAISGLSVLLVVSSALLLGVFFTGVRAPRDLSPQNRLSDSQNWRTVELVLSGAVFLTMGVQIKSIVTNVEQDHAGVGTAVLIAAGALGLVILVRAAYVAPLLGILAGRARQTRSCSPDPGHAGADEHAGGQAGDPRPDELAWAQEVGAGSRPLRRAVLIAFAVAALSLLVQGGTIGPLLRVLAPAVDPAATGERTRSERTRIFELLRTSAATVPAPPHQDDPHSPEGFEVSRRHRLAVLGVQRSALLDARDNGTFDAEVLAIALANLDASQINIEMRSRLAG